MTARWLARLCVALSLTLLLPPGGGSAIASPVGGAATITGGSIRSVAVRAPRAGVPLGKPVQVLVALHGMGGSGDEFSRDLQVQADRYGWLVVAPTIAYGDWTNPDQVTREDPALIRALAEYLDQLPRLTGLTVRKRVLLLGHSRGAQLAHRFAEFKPDRVLAVAAMSAGTYTLPLASGPQGGLRFPFGINDLSSYAGRSFDARNFQGVQFWVGVGAQDTNAADLPRQWDAYEGTTRLQRAQAFEAAMQAMGASSVLRVFTNTRHEITGEMRTAACAFLGNAAQPRAQFGSPLSQAPIAS